jgi:hypothetical protein
MRGAKKACFHRDFGTFALQITISELPNSMTISTALQRIRANICAKQDGLRSGGNVECVASFSGIWRPRPEQEKDQDYD